MRLRVGVAREQVRRLETGAGEQQRRLREEEAKNRRLELERSQQGHDQKVAGAEALAQREEEIAALAADIAKRETELEERQGLLRDAVAAAARDRDEIGALEVERQCARYLGALSAARAATAALDAAREHARQAAALERKAAATREEAADLHAPAGAELDQLRSLETELAHRAGEARGRPRRGGRSGAGRHGRGQHRRPVAAGPDRLPANRSRSRRSGSCGSTSPGSASFTSAAADATGRAHAPLPVKLGLAKST